MEEEKYNPFGSPGNKVGRGSSTERDRAERDSAAAKSSTSGRAVGRRKRPKTDRIR